MLIERRLLAAASLTSTLLCLSIPAVAQQSSAKGEALDAIIGTQVEEEEAQAAADQARIIAAIEKSADSIVMVRKASSLDKVEIVFLADATPVEGGPPALIAEKIRQHESEIGELRKEIEGNAMLFHAIDSRQILPRDVLAVEFVGSGSVVIYAAAKPAG